MQCSMSQKQRMVDAAGHMEDMQDEQHVRSNLPGAIC